MSADKHEPDSPKTEFNAIFSFGSEPSFRIVETNRKTDIKILKDVGEIPIDTKKGYEGVFEQTTAFIDELIAKNKVPAEDRERLIRNTRQSYLIVLHR